MSAGKENLTAREMKVLIGLSTLLAALDELDGGWMPRNGLYVALGADLGASEAAIQIAESQGWVTSTTQTVTLTDKGRAKARAMAASRAARTAAAS